VAIVDREQRVELRLAVRRDVDDERRAGYAGA
jgi:hypothetical protein